jgi:hypothetical protein
VVVGSAWGLNPASSQMLQANRYAVADEEPVPQFGVLVESADRAAHHVAYQVHLAKLVHHAVGFGVARLADDLDEVPRSS